MKFCIVSWIFDLSSLFSYIVEIPDVLKFLLMPILPYHRKVAANNKKKNRITRLHKQENLGVIVSFGHMIKFLVLFFFHVFSSISRSCLFLCLSVSRVTQKKLPLVGFPTKNLTILDQFFLEMRSISRIHLVSDWVSKWVSD